MEEVTTVEKKQKEWWLITRVLVCIMQIRDPLVVTFIYNNKAWKRLSYHIFVPMIEKKSS